MNTNNIIGKKYNSRTILSFSHNVRGRYYFETLCDCGYKTVSRFDLLVKTKKCIHCRKENLKSYIGRKFNFWTVVSVGSSYYYRDQWIYQFVCRCKCGNVQPVLLSNLKSGNSKSCGCKPYKTKYSNIKDKSLYHTWHGMIDRCYNKENNNYKNYGERGVTVCDRWRNSFENFVTDMGEKPSAKHSIDRRDNDGNYEPSNCRWATKNEQTSNTRFSGKLTQINLAQKVGRTREYIRQIWRRNLLPFVSGYVGKSPIFTEDAIQFILDGKHKMKMGRPPGSKNRSHRLVN